MPIPQQQVYSDVDLKFIIHPLNHDINVLYNEDAIKRSLKHLILSNRGDFKFHPEIDVGLRDSLFEPMTSTTVNVLKKKIRVLIEQYMERVKLIRVDIEPNAEMDGYDIEITFNTINILRPITTTLFLQRIR